VPFFISPAVRKKLAAKHNVTEDEVRQCFLNVNGVFLRDKRERHDSDPPTWWFVAETNRGRLLKVCFCSRRIETSKGHAVLTEIKTAFPPDVDDLECWKRHGSY
jgi:uncharacterized DUF497 family protein